MKPDLEMAPIPPPPYSERTPLLSSNRPPLYEPESSNYSYQETTTVEVTWEKDDSARPGAGKMFVALVVIFSTAFVLPLVWVTFKGVNTGGPWSPLPETVVKVAVIGELINACVFFLKYWSRCRLERREGSTNVYFFKPLYEIRHC